MLNFKNQSIKRSDCYYCGPIRKHPKPSWHGCLNFKNPSCPQVNTPSHNVLAPSNAQHSKVMRDVQLLKVTAPGRRFKLQQQTKEYQTRIITNSTNNKANLVIRNGTVTNQNPIQDNLQIKPNCPNSSNMTWSEISALTKEQVDSYYGGARSGCGYYKPPSQDTTVSIDTVCGQQCNRMQQWQPR